MVDTRAFLPMLQNAEEGHIVAASFDLSSWDNSGANREERNLNEKLR